ncbi:hypothetical protein AB6A40_003632 [Gnathostoma spinigerum]|uniref:Uncharacterized protein n=1 Tax=Gnathostoma spinigerum TaxID=75299 RepID=A0ABD6EA98_9BILA
MGFRLSDVHSVQYCRSNVCLNGGTCEVDEAEHSFRCICPEGFIGDLCQSISECHLKCANGGECHLEIDTEICRCRNGYSGEHCEVASLDCQIQGCAPNEGCIEVADNTYKCVPDKCSSMPCQNGGKCTQDQEETFTCECPTGFSGEFCSNDINECEGDPCFAGGTCVNTFGSFKCLCPPGRQGTRCEVEDDCLVSPCLNGGRCVVGPNGYQCVCPAGYISSRCEVATTDCTCSDEFHICVNNTCICPAGYTGEKCEKSLESCQSKNPCLNGGTCVSNTSGISCICTLDFYGTICEHAVECDSGRMKCVHGKCFVGTEGPVCECEDGYSGKYCEVQSDKCEGVDCNGGVCSETNGQQMCACPEGRFGNFCENKNPCIPNPCQNSGKCQQLSSEMGLEFSCTCLQGFSGKICEFISDSSGCDYKCGEREKCEMVNGNHECLELPDTCSDCKNSTTTRCLEMELGSSICVCKQGWSGPRCTYLSEQCNGEICAGNKVCRKLHPLDPPKCECLPGVAGSDCSARTTVTLRSTSLFLHQFPLIHQLKFSPHPYSLRFGFRTTLIEANIVRGENVINQNQFTIGIRDGSLVLNVTDSEYFRVKQFVVNDDRWYTVIFNCTSERISLMVLEDDVVLSQMFKDSAHSVNVYWTRFGQTPFGSYSGCLRDLFINDHPINLLNSTHSVGIEPGCRRSAPCSPSPCHNNGKCVDLWDNFLCECRSPYLPPYCVESLSEVTFGHDNHSSFVEFNAKNNSDSVNMKTVISFLMRTNKPNATILYIGEKGADDVGTFISLSLINGLLELKSRIGGKKIFSKRGSVRLDDNDQHLIRVDRTNNKIKVSIDDSVAFDMPITNRFPYPLLADSLIVGSSKRTPPEAYSTDDFYKGTIQDLKINGKSVAITKIPENLNLQLFGQKIDERNILEGTVSDDVCSLWNPCVNGYCENTFNDFYCKCNTSWTGRTCTMKDHCVTNPCTHRNAICTNLIDGYVCTPSSTTFYRTSRITYALRGPPLLSSSESKITFAIRTRSEYARILYLESPSAHFSIELNSGSLSLIHSSSGHFVEREMPMGIADGHWHNISVHHDTIFVDGKASLHSDEPLFLDSFLVVNNTTLTVGYLLNDADPPSFTGCLTNLTIAQLPPLSFYPIKESGNISENTTRFIINDLTNVQLDECHSLEMCGMINPCKNGAICKDLWNKRSCECMSGFRGEFCEINIDECLENDCVNSVCVDGIGNYSCKCLPGFTGADCREKEDLCLQNPCQHGGICHSTPGSFTCECRPNFVGVHCQTLANSSCAELPCGKHANCTDNHVLIYVNAPTNDHFNTSDFVQSSFTCQCPSGWSGVTCDIRIDHCKVNTCQNGGTCVSQPYGTECHCTSAYKGASCSELVDTCSFSPCAHGQCKNIWGGRMCQCAPGWQGPNCDIDIDECKLLPCHSNGLCKNTEGGYTCSCSQYFFGEHCQLPGSCTAAPCGTTGDCVQHSRFEHTCECHHGYTGDSCDELIDYCVGDPCMNGATCEKLVGSYRCHCLPGFSGDNCSVDIDECVGEVCMNGGRCIDKVNAFICDCSSTGFEGERCENDVNECKKGICVRGICHNEVGSFSCECEEGYIGKYCHLQDPCTSNNTISNNSVHHHCDHGTCFNPTVEITSEGNEVVHYECHCTLGYSGPLCSQLVLSSRCF